MEVRVILPIKLVSFVILQMSPCDWSMLIQYTIPLERKIYM
jgi:hypothetical protein